MPHPAGAPPLGEMSAPGRGSRFSGALHHWLVERSSRTFTVGVVEPSHYAPELHSELFNFVMTGLLYPEPEPINPFDRSPVQSSSAHFDLITFPEAFVTAGTLLDALRTFTSFGPSGCIHVGLRPSDDPERHLFAVTEMKDLVDRLMQLSSGVAVDIAVFSQWLTRQHPDHFFNIGCLFIIDAIGCLRVCLHPKAVRSQFETNPLPESHMKEADLLTLITLSPVDKQYLSVTLQPLICSDALDLQTDQPGGNPMEAVNRHLECFGDRPPDHIDVVSVATCTPQPEGKTSDAMPYREWHERFQTSFKDLALKANFTRHHFSTMVLSNFRTLKSGLPGGLSGVFLPVPPKYKGFHADVTVSCWGYPKGGIPNNYWSRPDDQALEKWSSLGFVAGLDPFSEPTDASVKVFRFTIQRLPRDNSLWGKPESLTQCEVHVGRRDPDGKLTFSRQGNSHVQ
jgi:hypothetical protein